MKQKENLLDRIDAAKVNSVSDEDFEVTWGVKLEEHLNRVMAFVETYDQRMKHSIK